MNFTKVATMQDVLLAIWDGKKSGGVWSTIRKAQKAGKQIVYCPKEVLEG